MNTDTSEVDLLHTLYANIKACFTQYKDYALCEAIGKLSKFFTTLILLIIGMHLATALLIFLTFQMAYFLASLWGSLLLAIAGVIGVYIMLGILLYCNRHRWIHRPILRLLLRAFNRFSEAQSSTPALELFKRKEEIKVKLYQAQDAVSTTLCDLVSPSPPASFMEKALRLIECGSSFFKGIKQGYDFIRKR